MNIVKPVLGADGPVVDKILFKGAPVIRHSYNPVFKSGYPVIYAMRPVRPEEKMGGAGLDYLA